jgi:hypothetical protein
MTPRSCDCHVCRTEPLSEPSDVTCVAHVLEHGWHVMVVGAGSCDCGSPDCGDSDEGPAFAYTVGLPHQFGHPELVMSGQRGELMHRALNAAARMVQQGHDFRAGVLTENVIGRFPVLAEHLTVEACQELLRFSWWFHRWPGPGVQLVWPDTAGIWPWQPGATTMATDLQPPGWRVPSPRRGAVAPDPPWPFPVGPDELVWTCRCINREGASISLVARDLDDGVEAWQLLCASDHTQDLLETVERVHMAHLVRSAPSLYDLVDMLPGERAWRDAPWLPWRTTPGESLP